MGSQSFLQGIFPVQGSNLGLPHCRQILYHLSRQGSPTIRKVQNESESPILCEPWTIASQARKAKESDTTEWLTLPLSYTRVCMCYIYMCVCVCVCVSHTQKTLFFYLVLEVNQWYLFNFHSLIHLSLLSFCFSLHIHTHIHIPWLNMIFIEIKNTYPLFTHHITNLAF